MESYWTDGWDVSRYREEHESDDHWELRRLFLERWKYDYPEEKLLCLAKVFANMEWLGCRCPTEAMQEVARLSHDVIEAYRSSRANKLDSTLVPASVLYKTMDVTDTPSAPLSANAPLHNDDTRQLVASSQHTADVSCPSSVISTEEVPPRSTTLLVLDESNKASCSSVQSMLSASNMMAGNTSTSLPSISLSPSNMMAGNASTSFLSTSLSRSNMMAGNTSTSCPSASETAIHLEPNPVNKLWNLPRRESEPLRPKPCGVAQPMLSTAQKVQGNTSTSLPTSQQPQNPKTWSLIWGDKISIITHQAPFTSSVTNQPFVDSNGDAWQIAQRPIKTEIISDVDTETAISEALDKKLANQPSISPTGVCQIAGPIKTEIVLAAEALEKKKARNQKIKARKKNKKQRRKGRELREAAAMAMIIAAKESAVCNNSNSHPPVPSTANLNKALVGTAANSVIVCQPVSERPGPIKGMASIAAATKNARKKAQRKANKAARIAAETSREETFTLLQPRLEQSDEDMSAQLSNRAVQVAEKRPDETMEVEPSGMVATTYKQSAAANLIAAITTDIYAPLDVASATYVLEYLTNQIVKEALKYKDRTFDNSPKFAAAPRHTHGQVRVCCGDEYTLSWLKEHVAKLRLPSGDRLIASRLSEIPVHRRIRCGILIPGRWDDAKEIEKTLRFQNPWAQVHRWWFHGSDIQEKNKEVSTFVVVTIPEDIIPSIMKEERRLAFCLGTIYVKFFAGPKGKLVKRPPLPKQQQKAFTPMAASTVAPQAEIKQEAMDTPDDFSSDYSWQSASQNL